MNKKNRPGGGAVKDSLDDEENLKKLAGTCRLAKA